jgi:hypothetical protein
VALLWWRLCPAWLLGPVVCFSVAPFYAQSVVESVARDAATDVFQRRDQILARLRCRSHGHSGSGPQPDARSQSGARCRESQATRRASACPSARSYREHRDCGTFQRQTIGSARRFSPSRNDSTDMDFARASHRRVFGSSPRFPPSKQVIPLGEHYSVIFPMNSHVLL